jgi:3-hydroxyisobutyrate dehydrogenase-like beta-hydroxyacid dehydrogenase
MGAAVGGALAAAGHKVVWASEGRSPQSASRAAQAGLIDVLHIPDLLDECDVVLSICPPHAAPSVAGHLGAFNGIYVDANAIAPSTSEGIAQSATAAGASYVDGGIVGPPPLGGASTRLYLSGGEAATVARLFNDTDVESVVLEAGAFSASALKMSYAAWSKGSAALLLSARALARAHGIESALKSEWDHSAPDLNGRAESAADQALQKGWRWSGEMLEIARSMNDVRLPGGLHEAAADIYSRLPRMSDVASGQESLDRVLDLMLGTPAPPGP